MQTQETTSSSEHLTHTTHVNVYNVCIYINHAVWEEYKSLLNTQS